MNEIEKIAQKCIIEHLNLSNDRTFSPDAILYTMGINSLDLMEIIIAMENKLSIKIPNADAAKIRTFKELCETFEKYA